MNIQANLLGTIGPQLFLLCLPYGAVIFSSTGMMINASNNQTKTIALKDCSDIFVFEVIGAKNHI